MPPQPSGKRPQIAGDDRTQVLAPVAPDAFRQKLLDGWEDECRRTGAANWMLDRAALTAPYRLGYGFGPRPADETAVIPVTPAQPQPINDGEPYNDHPWCRKRLVAIAVIFGSGMVVGAFIATIRWWFG